MKASREGAEQDVSPHVRWTLDLPEEIDVLVACDSGLRRIQKLLDEWDKRSAA